MLFGLSPSTKKDVHLLAHPGFRRIAHVVTTSTVEQNHMTFPSRARLPASVYHVRPLLPCGFLAVLVSPVQRAPPTLLPLNPACLGRRGLVCAPPRTHPSCSTLCSPPPPQRQLTVKTVFLADARPIHLTNHLGTYPGSVALPPSPTALSSLWRCPSFAPTCQTHPNRRHRLFATGPSVSRLLRVAPRFPCRTASHEVR